MVACTDREGVCPADAGARSRLGAAGTFACEARGVSFYRLAEDTVGNGTYEGNPESLSARPAAVISNAACSGQLALGYLRNLYLACSGAVYVYGPNASGNAAPLRT